MYLNTRAGTRRCFYVGEGVKTPMHTFWMQFEFPTLADMSNWSADRGGVYQSIAQEDVMHCLKACKSRRNMAGRLESRLFWRKRELTATAGVPVEKPSTLSKCQQYTPVALPTTPLSV